MTKKLQVPVYKEGYKGQQEPASYNVHTPLVKLYHILYEYEYEYE